MTEVILVNTPPKYGQSWWTDNMKHMLDSVNFKYKNINIISDEKYEGVYNKIAMFDRFKEEKQYLYLDVDMIIKDSIDHLVRENFTLLNAWFRPTFHTPLNSSVMSWKGDRSDIFEKFNSDPDYYMMKYNKGIDEYIFKEISYETYPEKICNSYLWMGKEKTFDDSDYPITLFNGAADLMKIGKGEWYHKYLL